MAGHETDPLLPNAEPAPEVQDESWRPSIANESWGQSITNEPRRNSITNEPRRYSITNEPDNPSNVAQEELSNVAQSQANGLRNLLPFIPVIIAGIFIWILFTDLPSGVLDPPSTPSRTLDQRVTQILTENPLIDGHNDLAILIRFLYNNHIYDEKFSQAFTEGGMPAHVDLPRLKEGKVGGAFWAAFVPCPANGTDFSDENYKTSVAFTYNQIDLLRRLQALYPTTFSPPPNSSTAMSLFRKERLILSPLAIEALHQIGNSLSNLRTYHSLGVRYATLTHNCHNAYADAALTSLPNGGGLAAATPFWHGVSPAGRALIHEMNRMGMIVDLSHVSYDTMRQVLGGDSNSSPKWEGSIAPPIFSHSSAYALCPHPRNVPDDVLALVKARDSLVMVNFAPDFVSCVPAPGNANGLPDFYPANSTLEHVVSHIMYIGDLIGYDHVGLGSDFDGIPTTPKGLEDVSKFPDLAKEMLKRGVSDADVAKVVGGNLLRVWGVVDEVAARLQREGTLPAEDELPGLRFGEQAGWI